MLLETDRYKRVSGGGGGGEARNENGNGRGGNRGRIKSDEKKRNRKTPNITEKKIVPYLPPGFSQAPDHRRLASPRSVELLQGLRYSHPSQSKDLVLTMRGRRS